MGQQVRKLQQQENYQAVARDPLLAAKKSYEGSEFEEDKVLKGIYGKGTEIYKKMFYKEGVKPRSSERVGLCIVDANSDKN